MSNRASVEHVARALCAADMKDCGRCWPWPTGRKRWENEARASFRQIARVALNAIEEFRKAKP